MMKRLEWKAVSRGTLSAIQDGWAYTITQNADMWQLCAEPIQYRGPDCRKFVTASFLQDVMAIAQALVAGVDLSGES